MVNEATSDLRIYELKVLRNSCSRKPGRSGQSTTEFIVVLAFLSVIGFAIMSTIAGNNGNSGAIHTMSDTGANKISKDPD